MTLTRARIGLVATAIILLALAAFAASRCAARVSLAGQTLNVAMPADLPVDVEVIEAGPPRLPEPASSSASGVPVRLKETLSLVAHIDARVPLKTTVRYVGRIPIKASVPLNATVRTTVLGIPITAPVRGEMPIDLQLPVDLSIPIDQPIHLKLDAPITATIDQVVHIPLRANLKTRISFADASIPVGVTPSELTLPLAKIRLTGAAP